MTRNEYMDANSVDGEKAHREYYSQFVSESVKQRVLARIGKDKLIRSTDQRYFNDISLHIWDMLMVPVPYSIAQKLRAQGDYPTLCSAVCILKEAARQIVEGEQKS